MKQPSKRIFNANKGYYVEFFSRWKDNAGLGCDYGASGAFEEGGKVKVMVYKSLDKYSSTITPHVEHIVEVGSFDIHDLKQKTISDFLNEVREGIAKIVSQKPAE